jgi:superfamily II DNA or RNA helicase
MFTLTVTNKTTLHPVTDLPVNVLERIRERLTFQNPQWIENDKRGFSNWDTPQELCYLEEAGDSLIVPRGFTRQAIGILTGNGVRHRVDDKRRLLPVVDFGFTGKLRDFQEEAVSAMLERDFGTLSAPTGSGKTVMALALIAARRQPALVVTHTRELANQWCDRIESFLGIPVNEVGRIGGGKQSIGGKISVATVQTLIKCAADVAPYVGHLVVDECHRVPSRTFLEAVTAFDCRYQLGLSATPYRRDGLGRLIWYFVGDKVHEIQQADMIETGNVLRAEVVIRQTNFVPMADPSLEYSAMLSELCEDRERNALIASDVAREARHSKGVVLLLSDRKSHCETLQRLLAAKGIEAHLLTGDLSTKARTKVVDDLNNGQVKVLVATGQLIGEGFDCRELSTLFLACPVKFSGRLIQYLGRVLRPAPGKRQALVFDYLDAHVPVLEASAKSRAQVYQQAV